MISHIATILWKDLLSEFRSKELILSMLIFSLMVAVIFNFSFPPGSKFIQEAAPGILWMTFIFASLLGMNRTFVNEVDKGCLQGLLLTPIDRVVIYISKFLANFIFISIVELIALPIFSIFYDFKIINSLWPLLLVICTSTIGFAVIGTLFSAITVNTKMREMMLPILHFPISFPIILAAVQATAAIFQNKEGLEIWGWLKIVIAFDIIFFIVATLTFEYIIEE